MESQVNLMLPLRWSCILCCLYILDLGCRVLLVYNVMYQSIPAVPIPPRANPWALDIFTMSLPPGKPNCAKSPPRGKKTDSKSPPRATPSFPYVQTILITVIFILWRHLHTGIKKHNHCFFILELRCRPAKARGGLGGMGTAGIEIHYCIKHEC